MTTDDLGDVGLRLVLDEATAIEPDAGPERRTDLGNAKALVCLHGQDLRHTKGRGWLVWDDRRWRADDRPGLGVRLKDLASQ